MTPGRTRAARAAATVAVSMPAVLWVAGPAAAAFSSGAGASASYSTAVLAAPTGVDASVSDGTVTVTWVPATSPPSAGTRVLRSASAGGPYTEVGSVTGAMSALSDSPGPGVWYYTAESYTAGWTSPAATPVGVTVTSAPSWRGQVASGSSPFSFGPLTLTTTAAVPGGDLLTVRAAVGASMSIASVTDPAGDTFTRRAAVSEQGSVTSELWTARIGAGLAAGSSIVVTWSGFSFAPEAAVVDDFASVTGTLDGSGTAAGFGGHPSATTPSAPGDLVVAVTGVGAPTSDGYTEAAGWHPLGQTGATGFGWSSVSVHGGWQIASSATTVHAPGLGSPAGWAEAVVALPAG